MTFTKEQQKITLGALIVLIALVNGYRFMTNEKPKTVPLMYERGAVASSPVRQGLLSRGSGADPLNVFLERHDERYPGVTRDFFRMENPVIRQKPAQVTTIKTPPPPPPVPVKTPEEIAAEASRADLSRFRFLGYLTDKESTLFLSKDGELFIVKSGDRVLKNYKVKEANKDFVVLLDTVTQVEMRIDMSGSEAQQQTPQQQLQQPQQPQQQRQQPLVQQPTQQPVQPPVQDQVPQPKSGRQMQKQEIKEIKKEMQQKLQQQ
jgi:hypothetical protein